MRDSGQQKHANTRPWQVASVILTLVFTSFAGPASVLATTTATFAAPVAYAAGTNPHGVAVADLNGDGKADLVITNAHGNSLSVLLGTGTGTFGGKTDFATGTRPKYAAVGDFNEDGKPDLASVNQDDSTTSILLGSGTGSFGAKIDYATCLRGHEIVTGDFNEDTHRDLAVACWNTNLVAVLLGHGDGTFAAHTDFVSGSAPHSLVVGRFNADTHDDLAVANHGEGKVGVLLGTGTGGFAAVVKYSTDWGPHSVRAADLDGDGKLDLVTANDGEDSVSVLRGVGDGTFAPRVDYAAGAVPKSVAIADFNHDGRLDLVAADTAGNGDGVTGHPNGDKLALLLGTGGAAFAPATFRQVGQTPFAVVVGLLNADSLPDLVTANWDSNDATVLLNTSDITPPVTSAPAARILRPASVTAAALSLRLTWTASDAGSGLSAIEVGRSLDSGVMTKIATLGPTVRALTATTTPGHRYVFAVRARDAQGNLSAWVSGPVLRPTLYAETTSAAAYSGSWAVGSSSSYLGGHVKAAYAAGARITFSFTGRAVAWIAPQSSTRGSAKVYVDGVYVGTVSLYSSTSHSRQVMFERLWTSVGYHTLRLVVVGTSGHPRVDVDGFAVLR